MKNILPLFVMVLTICFTAHADDGDVHFIDNFKYTVLSESDRLVSIGRYKEISGELVIPTSVKVKKKRIK